eukprot:2275564-Pleurochrysis_carterae.AAC.1
MEETGYFCVRADADAAQERARQCRSDWESRMRGRAGLHGESGIEFRREEVETRDSVECVWLSDGQRGFEGLNSADIVRGSSRWRRFCACGSGSMPLVSIAKLRAVSAHG